MIRLSSLLPTMVMKFQKKYITVSWQSITSMRRLRKACAVRCLNAMLDVLLLLELLISLAAVRAPARVVPTQLQLIMQQPNGVNWIRVCAMQNNMPTLQEVYMYNAALKLIIDSGHDVSEETYSGIVREHRKLAIQQQQEIANKRRSLAMINTGPASSPHPPPPPTSMFGNRAYVVRF